MLNNSDDKTITMASSKSNITTRDDSSLSGETRASILNSSSSNNTYKTLISSSSNVNYDDDDEEDGPDLNISKLVLVNNVAHQEWKRSTPLKTYSKKSVSANMAAVSRYGRSHKPRIDDDFLSTDKKVSQYLKIDADNQMHYFKSSPYSVYKSPNSKSNSPLNVPIAGVGVSSLPSANVSTPVSGQTSSSAVPVKRGRGRPRKIQTQTYSTTDRSETELNSSLSGGTPKSDHISSVSSHQVITEPNASTNSKTKKKSKKSEKQSMEKAVIDLPAPVSKELNVPLPTSTETLPLPPELMDHVILGSSDTEDLDDSLPEIKPISFPIDSSVSSSSSYSAISGTEVEMGADGQPKWMVGDLAWASVGGYPFWPCTVTRDPFENAFTKCKFIGKFRQVRDLVHVRFFGDHGRRSWINASNIMPFQGLDAFMRLADQKSTPQMKKKYPKIYRSFTVSPTERKSWQAAVSEAESLREAPRSERIKYFNETFPSPQTTPTKVAKSPTKNISSSPTKHDSNKKSPAKKRRQTLQPLQNNEKPEKKSTSKKRKSDTALIENPPKKFKQDEVEIKIEPLDDYEYFPDSTGYVVDTDLVQNIKKESKSPEKRYIIAKTNLRKKDVKNGKAAEHQSDGVLSPVTPLKVLKSSPISSPLVSSSNVPRGRGRPRKYPKLDDSVANKVNGVTTPSPSTKTPSSSTGKKKPIKKSVTNSNKKINNNSNMNGDTKVKNGGNKDKKLPQKYSSNLEELSFDDIDDFYQQERKKSSKLGPGFVSFCDKHFDQVADEDPSLTATEVHKYLEKMWSELSDAVKARYRSKTQEENEIESESDNTENDSRRSPPPSRTAASSTTNTNNNNNNNNNNSSKPNKRGVALFSGVKSDKVCIVCFKGNELGEVLKCKGPCCNYLHVECSSLTRYQKNRFTQSSLIKKKIKRGRPSLNKSASSNPNPSIKENESKSEVTVDEKSITLPSSSENHPETTTTQIVTAEEGTCLTVQSNSKDKSLDNGSQLFESLSLTRGNAVHNSNSSKQDETNINEKDNINDNISKDIDQGNKDKNESSSAQKEAGDEKKTADDSFDKVPNDEQKTVPDLTTAAATDEDNSNLKETEKTEMIVDENVKVTQDNSSTNNDGKSSVKVNNSSEEVKNSDDKIVEINAEECCSNAEKNGESIKEKSKTDKENDKENASDCNIITVDEKSDSKKSSAESVDTEIAMPLLKEEDSIDTDGKVNRLDVKIQDLKAEIKRELANDDKQSVDSDKSNDEQSVDSEKGQARKIGWMCNLCVEGKDGPCIICGLDTGEVVRCNTSHCGKVYHLQCLSIWPQKQIGQSAKGKLVLNCPQHSCHTCISDNPSSDRARFSNDKLVRCVACPSSYHYGNYCIPAGSELLSTTQMICPRHYVPLKDSLIHVNASWCSICAVGGSLICCDTCPNSFHAECLKIDPPEGSFICEDCETGRIPLYGEIVWVKLGSYRWWPARILYPLEIPENLRTMKHAPVGEFVVEFFGTHDYFWINRGRAFFYHEGDGANILIRSRTDELFIVGMNEASEAYKLYQEERESREAYCRPSMKPPKYVKILTNRPYGSLRSTESDVASMTACECDPEKENPCGRNSDCINRLLMVECNPQICPAGDKCQNQNFEKRIYPPLLPFRTENRGWGLKTMVDLKKGDFIIEYVGEMIDEEEYKKRVIRKQKDKDENYYFLTIDKDRMLDAGPKGNLARFMNHSCNPNCETQKWTVNGDTRVGLFALVDIPSNTELVFNYNLETIGNTRVDCKCGAPSCGGYIGAKVNKSDDRKNSVAANNKKKKQPKKSVNAGTSSSSSVNKSSSKSSKVSEKTCFTCGDGGELLLCDNGSCPKAYHLDCLGLTKYPSGIWECPRHICSICSNTKVQTCAHCINSYCEKHAEGNITSHRTHGLICFSCSQSESGSDWSGEGSDEEETSTSSNNKKAAAVPSQHTVNKSTNKSTTKSLTTRRGRSIPNGNIH
ncbi:hypothetical protein O3M35_011977 [Rhynocoris fuscipes]|uniref:Uncharacterized protein n=1 Tax=Rhynocoris fuscipes TaxID=488301 RepID=A0AAW1CQQ6_9HEMI